VNDLLIHPAGLLLPGEFDRINARLRDAAQLQ
jgi:hypothetical protein